MSMMRNLFGGGGLSGPFANISALFQKFNQFRQNPLGALISTNVNLPQGINNDPESIVNYLRSSGQMSEDQFNQFSQMANQFQSFLPKKF